MGLDLCKPLLEPAAGASVPEVTEGSLLQPPSEDCCYVLLPAEQSYSFTIKDPETS